MIGTFTYGSGNAGRAEVTAPRLVLSNGGRVNSSTAASGNGGQLVVRVNDLSVDGAGAGQLRSEISASAAIQDAATQRAYLLPPVPTGNTGDVQITGDRLSLTNGGQITVQHDGTGNVGRLQIDVNAVQLSDRSQISATTVDGQGGSVGLNGRSLSMTNASTITGTTRGTGNGSNISINTNLLELLNGGQVSTSTLAQGRAGNLTVNAADRVTIAGVDPQSSSQLSGLFTNATATAIGAGGDLRVTTGDLSLSDRAQINATTAGQGNAGNIALTLNNLQLQSGAQITAATSSSGNAGSLTVNATGDITLRGESTAGASQLLTRVEAGASGQGGNLSIAARTLTVQDGAEISAGTQGTGNSGSLSVRATDVNLSGVSASGRSRTGLSTTTTTTGQGGALNLTTGTLAIADGAAIRTGTEGAGNAGNLNVRATGDVTIAGATVTNPSGLFTTSTRNATGRAGDIQLNVQNLQLRNGGQVAADTLGTGNAGNLTVVSREEITAIGESANGQFASGLLTDVGQGAAGRGGNLNVTSDRLTLRNGAAISAATSGTGNAGTLTVNAERINLSGESLSGRNTTGFSTSTRSSGQGGNLSVTGDRLNISDGAFIRTGTSSSGNSGDLSVRVDRINISSENLFRPSTNPFRFPGGISTAVQSPQATGRGGDLTVVSDRLTLRQSGQISASTAGQGDAGNVTIRANIFNIFGNDVPSSAQTIANAGVSTFSGLGAGGNGGNVTIISDRFSVQDGGNVTAGTLGRGNAGDVTLRARETILQGGNRTGSPTGLFSTSILSPTGIAATGQAGNVTLRGDRLRVLNGALIGTGTFTSGNGGDIRINVDDIEVSGSAPTGAISALRSSVENATATGRGGDIVVQGDRLRLLDGGQITSSTVGRGSAGDVRVNVRSIELAGVAANAPANNQQITSFRNSNISAAAVSPTGNNAAITGSAGSVTVNTDTLQVSNGAALSVSSLGSGNAGNLNIRANSVQLNNGGILQAETNAGDQGNLRINAPVITLTNNSRITTNAQGTATGGNININTQYLFAFQNSDITANSISNFGGQVGITADGIFGAEFRPNLTPDNDITASSGLGTGFSGTVTLQTPNIDPGQGLTQLPDTVIDPNAQVASTCQAIAQNTFVVTGRGGLPATPTANNNDDRPWSDLRDLSTFAPQPSTPTPLTTAPVEATGWQVGRSGQLELVAIDPTLPSLQQPTCASSPTTQPPI